MARHIHIHIHRKTSDSGNFEESKHKRDASGRFTAGGMNAEQHMTEAKKHDEHATRIASERGDITKVNQHNEASHNHREAAFHLREAQHHHKRQDTVPTHPHRIKEHIETAEEHAAKAKKHAGEVAKASAGGQSKPPNQRTEREQAVANLNAINNKIRSAAPGSPQHQLLVEKRRKAQLAVKAAELSGEKKAATSQKTPEGSASGEGGLSVGKSPMFKSLSEAQAHLDRLDAFEMRSFYRQVFNLDPSAETPDRRDMKKKLEDVFYDQAERRGLLNS